MGRRGVGALSVNVAGDGFNAILFIDDLLGVEVLLFIKCLEIFCSLPRA